MPRHQLLTEGNAFKTLIGFSLPFLLSNILQALYGACDLFMVGRFSDSVSVSAVATGGQIMQTISGLCIGLTTGGTVLIGQYFGAKKNREIAHAAKTLLILFSVFALLITGVTIGLLGPICSLMRVPAEAFEATQQYLFVCACGILFIVGYNVISAILRGIGDSRTPLILIAVACVTNIVTDYLLVGVMDMGAYSAAIATVFSQGVGLLLSVIYLSAKGFLRKYRSIRPFFRTFAAREILVAGLPIALQEGMVNVSFLIITGIVNGMGLVASASVGIVEKLIVFSMLPTTAFAAALAAMTAQHKGAGLLGRARKCMHMAIGLSLLFGGACFLLFQLKTSNLVSLFTTDPRVIKEGAWYLRSYSFDCILVCFVFCMNAFFTGSGHPVFPLVHSIIATLLIRLPLSYVVSRAKMASLFYIGFAAPAATSLSLLLCRWFLVRHYKEPLNVIGADSYKDLHFNDGCQCPDVAGK